MLRNELRALATGLALLFVAGLAAAQDAKDAKKDAKKGNYVIGTFESYKKETLTLKVDDKEKQFKVPGDTPVGYSTGKEDQTKILKAKDHLKDVKKGSFVAVTLDDEGKKVLAVGVVVSELPEGKSKEKDNGSDK
jgi:TusA-related sulfurtransferase